MQCCASSCSGKPSTAAEICSIRLTNATIALAARPYVPAAIPSLAACHNDTPVSRRAASNRLQRFVADSARGCVHDAFECRIRVRLRGQPHIAQRIFDFESFEKTDPP